MKFRKGYVSNSSSSSFVCDVCGEIESGWDLCLSECYMFECENGHCFHESCNESNKEFSAEDKIEIIKNSYKKNIKNYQIAYRKYEKENDDRMIEIVKERLERVEQKLKNPIDDFDEDELDEILSDEIDIRYHYPAKYCPICSLDVITSDDAVKYLYKKHDTTAKETKEEMKEKFNSIDELNKYCK